MSDGVSSDLVANESATAGKAEVFAAASSGTESMATIAKRDEGPTVWTPCCEAFVRCVTCMDRCARDRWLRQLRHLRCWSVPLDGDGKARMSND